MSRPGRSGPQNIDIERISGSCYHATAAIQGWVRAKVRLTPRGAAPVAQG
ncbi:MAG TPA: hypothetical protein VHD36_02420 [Pirellulales bacterium]|nr:hypothetical protein [Pirellulales bacterium]